MLQDAVPDYGDLWHVFCGRRSVVERPRTAVWSAPGEVEKFCTACGLIIHPLFEKMDVSEMEPGKELF